MRVRLSISASRWLVVASLLCLVGCAGSAPRWGTDATARPGWAHTGRAAVAAVKDPLTWAPLIGAAGLQIGDSDEQIADWANEATPVLGSRGSAADASDRLRAMSVGAYALAGLLAPAPEGRVAAAKARGFAVGGAALAATWGVTRLGKAAADRRRPLGQDSNSFPSGHTSSASLSVRLARHALSHYDLAPGASRALDLGFVGLAGMTGWARIEAGEHFPADVLAGMALGNFLAVFTTEAFLRPEANETLRLRARLHREEMLVRLKVRF